MFEFTRQGIISGFRSHGSKFLVAISLALLGTALLSGSFSGRQPATVALDVGFSGMRIVLLLMGLFWVQELFTKDLERKTLYFVLAYPITRQQYLFSRFTSAALLMALAVLSVGGLLWATLFYIGPSYQQVTPPALDGRIGLVLVGIWLDLIVVMSFAIMISTLSTTPLLPILIGLGFALAARGLGPTFDYLRNNPLANQQQASLLGPVLEYSYAWLPDLSRLDFRAWVLYDLPANYADFGYATLLALAYSLMALFLASVMLQRRDLA
ncbi:ABC transporter permease [Pseudomonas knackmussii]|uniref:ABC transporter permease n=1 Tax=Pseudomonas knackmussii TaxID=65741 RepID=A0ABY4KN57_9PSED|nr:ABC transporter permease subunit [Pseudomonas knackmussii]UPQ81989.1 ABC transporter permease [Pseudomonas knackmussii]